MQKWLVVLIPLTVAFGTGRIASAAVQAIPLSGAAASFNQTNFGIGYAIDGVLDANHGWAVDPNEHVDQWAVFDTDVQVAAGSDLTFTLSQLFNQNSNGQHLLREFQLSVIDAATHMATPVIPTVVSSTSTLQVSPTGVVLNASYPNVPDVDTYVLKATTPSTEIEGFRLYLFEPVGTKWNNNFVLTEFSVTGNVVPEPATVVTWSLLGAIGIAIGRWQRRKAA